MENGTNVMNTDEIQRLCLTTKNGNTISIFYNPDNSLLVVDIVAKNEKGGNELLRLYLDEDKLLKHCTSEISN